MGDRQDYVPGRRAASAGRTRPFSANNNPYGESRLSSSLGPGGFRGGRPMSAVGARASVAAWGEGNDGMGSNPPKRVHAQALAGAKGKEQLAEDVVALREQVSMLKEHLNTQKTEKRRIEAELIRAKQGLLKSEELLNNKERLMSPNTGISQLYRSPDTTQLVGNLKQQVTEYRAANARLEGEIKSIQKSLRATKVSELQSELMMANQELDRLSRISQVATTRMAEAETGAMAAKAAAQQARAAANNGSASPRSTSEDGIGKPANGTLRRTLQNMHQAHKVLQHEAEQLRTIFPNGMSMSDFTARARQQSNTAGAPDVLNFLRNHMAKLTSELAGQPGAPPVAAAPASSGRSSVVSPAKAVDTSISSAPVPVGHADLLPAVAAGVRKLRTLSERRWKESPPLQITAQELSDVMQLYVDEVRRLQGKAPLSEGAGDGSVYEEPVRSRSLALDPPVAAAAAPSNDADLQKALTDTLKAKKAAEAAATDSQAALDELKQARSDLNDANRKAAAAKKTEDDLRTQLAALQQQVRETAAAAKAAGAVIPDAPTSRSAPDIPVAAAAPAVPTENAYKVVVHTSDVSGGAFDGQVWITMYGSGYNNSGELLLPSDRYSFDMGQADEFTVSVPKDCLPDGMVVESIGLRMGESEIGDVTWHVAKVEIKPPTGETRTFWFEDWLKAGPVNRLFPRIPKGTGNVDYEVLIITSDYRGASTDAKVYITMVGDAGMAPEVLLDPKMLIGGTDASTLFARGAYDKMLVSAADVGDLSHIVLRIESPDGTAPMTSSWALESVKVVHAGTGMASMFCCYDWLTKDEPRITLTEGWTWLERSGFTISTVTSNMPGADFMGSVYVTLNGCWGSSSEALLVPAKSQAKEYDFKQGAKDAFKMQLEDKGELQSITLRVAPTSENDVTWNLDQIIVKPDGDGTADCVFNFGGWINGATTITVYKDTPQTQYKFSVVTAADSAQLAASVFATVEGSYGSTNEVQLVNDSAAGGNDNVITFKPGGVQEFSVKERDVGTLQRVVLRAAKVAAAATWKLDRMQITAGDATATSITFTVSPMEATTDNGGSVTLPRYMEQVEYKINAVTSDSPSDSGFDGQVFVKFTGADGVSEEVQLTGAESATPFTLSSNSSFVVKAGNVGQLHSIDVRLNQTGNENWWRPNRLEVTNTSTGQLGVFRYDSWMNTWNSYGYTIYQQTNTTYKVLVHASPDFVVDALGGRAGKPLTSKLLIKLSNWSGDSEEVEVPVPEGGLKPGGVATLEGFKCAISWVNNVTLRVADSQQVHVRMVELVNETGGNSSSWFRHNDYVSSTPVTMESCDLLTYPLTVVTAKGKGALPAGSKVYLSVARAGDNQVFEEVEVPLPEGCAAGSSVTTEVKTLRHYDIGELRLRTTATGSWGLQRIALTDQCAGNQYTFFNQSGEIKAPGSVSLVKLPMQKYTVNVTTTDRRGADSDGVIMMRIVGEKGETADLKMTLGYDDLSTWSGHALDRCHSDKFTLEAPDVGKLKEVVVSLVPSDWSDKARSSWHMASATVLQADTGLETTFAHDGWVDPGTEVVVKAGTAQETYVDYTIKLVTGYTGVFNGNAAMTLKDSSGTATQRIPLKRGAGTLDTSNPNVTTMVFNVRAASLGDIKECDLELESGDGDYYAMVQRVQVQNMANNAAGLFKYDTWLYTWYGAQNRQAAPCDVYCQTTLRTKNFPDAGFDGQVYLTLHGEQGDTPETQASNWWSSSFDPDSTTNCYVYIPDVGQINAVTVRLDGGSSKKWDLDYLDLYVYGSNQSSTFECANAIKVGKEGTVRLTKRKKTTKYELTTVTSDVRGAGTDGAVFVMLVGDNDTTEEIQLYESAEDLSRGTTHTFKFSSLDVGEVQSIHVRVGAPGAASNDTTLHSSWHCSKLDVLNMTSGLKCIFIANKWIGQEDGQVTLPQSSSEQALQTYRIQVTTSNEPGASFDGAAYLKLNGWYSSTDELLLAQPGRSTSSFNTGTQEFTIKACDIGPYVSSCTLRMVATPSDPKWNVDKVVVISENSTRPQADFFYNNWLSQDVPEATLSSQSTPAAYHVVLAVSADAAAAWDGQVFFTFNGGWSSSDAMELVNDSTAYEPGVAQEYDLEFANIGGINSIDVRVAGGSAGRSLKFDRIEITEKETGKKLDFIHSEAVSTDTGSVNVKVHLKEAEYKVALVTNADAANTVPFDGDVYITVYGTDGQTDEIKLVLPGEGGRPILSDGTSVLVTGIKSVEVGQLRYVYLRMDLCGTCSSYTLSSMEITNVTTSMTTRVMCGSNMSSYWNTNYCYPQTTTTYKVKVTTSSQADAAFDGAVHLSLGSWWSMGKEVLLANDSGTAAFAAGSVSEFTVSLTDVSYVSKMKLRVEANGNAKKWHCALVEVVDAACTSSSPVGFLINDWVAPDTTPEFEYLYSNTWDTCDIKIDTESGPFNGNLWVAVKDTDGKMSNEVPIMVAGASVLEPGATSSFGPVSFYCRSSMASLHLRADNNTASSALWKVKSVLLATSWGSQNRFELAPGGKAALPATFVFDKVPEVSYEVTVCSEDVPGNGTDGAVYLTLTGENGVSTESYLGGEHERGRSESTTLWLPDLGKLKSLTLTLKDEGSGVHSQWCVGSAEVTQTTSGIKTTFKAGNLWVERGGSVTCEVASSAQAYVDYVVNVYTKTGDNTGFDGGVRFKMEGDDGTQTAPVPLGKGDAEKGPYKSGGHDTFKIRALPMTVAHVYTDLDYTGNTSSWGLSYIVVERPDTKETWQFTPSGTVYAWNSYPEVEPTKTVWYNLEVFTTSVDKAGFDGNAFVTLVGKDGESKEHPLGLSSWDMGAGRTSSAYISNYDIGQLQEIKVRTSDGTAPKWNLGYMKVTNSDTGAMALFENLSGIKAGAPAVTLKRTIVTVQYDVTIHTMDTKGAGTDGDVYFKLVGANGETDEVLLRNGDDDFKRAAVDSFVVKGMDVGDSPTVQLRLASPPGSGKEGEPAPVVHSGWAVDRVEVLNSVTGVKGTYNYASWLNMPAACATLTQSSSVQALNKYKVRVTTGVLPGAGFDGDVYIEIQGWWGTISEAHLVQNGQTDGHFPEGQTVEYEVFGIDICKPTGVVVRFEPTDEDPAWMLERIEVENVTSGYTSEFHYNSWLNMEQKQDTIYCNNPPASYKIIVHTTDQADATFDGEAYLVLNGADGATEDILLIRDDLNSFQPASTETFEVKAANVGALRTCSVRLLTNKKEKKWHLERIEVQRLGEGGAEAEPVATFIHRGWIEAETVTLTKDLPNADYKVTVLTGEQTDAMFDGDVYITINGAEGATEEIKLVAPPKAAPGAAGDGKSTIMPPPSTKGGDAATQVGAPAGGAAAGAAAGGKLVFAAGSSHTVPVSAKNVGKINSVTVRIVSNGAEGCATNWFLDTLTVSEHTSGASSVFPYKAYVSDSSSSELYMPSSYTFTVKVHTSNVSGADFDGDIFVKFSNYWEEAKEEKLSCTRTSTGAFKAGSCEEFTFKVDSVGWVRYVDVWAVKGPESKASRWNCSHIEVLREDSGCEADQYHVHDWVAAGADPRKIDCTYMADYNLTMWIAPDAAGATLAVEDLNLFASFANTDGDMPQWSERQISLSLNPDEPGALGVTNVAAYTSSFKAPAPLGGITKMMIRAAAGSSGAAGTKWLVERVKVFENYNWHTHHLHFGASVAAGATVSAVPLVDETYDVTFVTGDLRGNGHDGSVSVVLEGLQMTSDELGMYNSNPNMFERGSTDTCRISMPNPGKLSTLGVKLAGEPHSQWFLERVDVVHCKSGMLTSFPCGKWVEPQESGTTVGPQLKLTPAGEPKDSYDEWIITVTTATTSDAAYDGEVSLVLQDSADRATLPIVLGTGSAETGVFQMGARNTFTIKGPSLADVSKASVRLSDKGSSSTWRIKRLEATNKKTGVSATFVCEEPARSYNWETALEEAPLVAYSVEASTGSGNDWSGEVYMVLYGSEGRSKEIPLQRWGGWPTYWAQDTRYFDLTAYAVGPLKAIGLRGMDDSGGSTPLPLESVKVIVDESQATSVFNLDGPLAPSKVFKTIKKKMDITDYQLVINTSDNRGAGTDADIFVTIRGDEGEIEEFKLNNGPDNFSRNRTDKFKFNGAVVGSNKTVTFRLAAPAGSTQPHSSWMCNYVSLFDLNSGMRTQFYHWNWVAPDVPTTLTENWTCKGLYPYTFTVKTGKAKGAEFTGEVWVKLSGWWGTTDEMLLAAPGKASHSFAAGGSDTFTVKGDDIGPFSSLEIVKLVGADAASTKWQLDSIQVDAVESPDNSCLFEHENWVNASDPALTLYKTMPNIPYKVTVFTAASSPVPVYAQPLLITMRGMLGACDQNQLVNESKAPLAPGSKEEYDLKDSDLGALTGLILGVKAAAPDEAAPTWQLDRVEVTNVGTGTTASFPLMTAGGTPAATWSLVDGKTWALDLPRLLPEAEYTVAVTTTDLPDALFDGDVMVTFTGSDGVTSALRLPADSTKAYNPNQTDTFTLKAPDVGALQSITVAIEAKGSSTQWHLADVSVTKGTGGAPCKFSYKSYLNQYNTSTTLYQQGSCKYDVTLLTTDKPEAAGFAGSVYVTLIGQYGSGTEVLLVPANQPPADAAQAIKDAAAKEVALEPGNSASFVMTGTDMGVIVGAKIRLEKDKGSKLDKWHCAKVVLRSERDPATPYVMQLNDWVQAGPAGASLTAKRLITYTADVVLAATQDATCDSTLALTLEGGTPEEPAVSKVEVKPPSGTWQPGVNTVTFEAMEFGTLRAVKVGALAPPAAAATPSAAPSEAGAAAAAAAPAAAAAAVVTIAQLKVVDNGGSTAGVFWRPASAPGLKQGGKEEALELLVDVSYTVTVVTADKRGAGTNGDVTLILTGDKGSTTELSLYNDWWSNFERGRTDTFDITAADVGVIKSAKLAVSSSANSGWLLSSLSVVNAGTGLKHEFKHDNWLGPREPSCTVELEDKSGGKKA